MTDRQVPRIFSQDRRAMRAARAESRSLGGDCAHWLAEELERDMIERIGFMRLEPATALILGCGRGLIEQGLIATGCQATTIRCPREELPLAGGPFDLIVSLAHLDTVNDLPGALIHLRSALADAGILLASITGAGSLPMLRQMMLAADGDRPAARLHPQVDSRAASALLQRAGFSSPVADSWPLRLRYASFDRLIADLRDQGLTNVLADPPPALGKAALERARTAFDRLRDGEGRVTETFEIVTLTAWR